MLWLIRKLFKKRKPRPVDQTEPTTASAPSTGKARSEWKATLLDSFEQNNVAPADEVILQSFDQFQNELYAPVMERRLCLGNLYAEIVADVAALWARVPDLIERAKARHAFELSRITEQQEDSNGRIS